MYLLLLILLCVFREIRRRAKQRKSWSFLDLTDQEFKLRFRLTKEAFIFLCQQLTEKTSLKGSRRISLELKVPIYPAGPTQTIHLSYQNNLELF